MFVYAPDRSFTYSAFHSGEPHVDLDRMLFDVMSDQWTGACGGRGPKLMADSTELNPIRSVGFLEWLVGVMVQRMTDLVAIKL